MSARALLRLVRWPGTVTAAADAATAGLLFAPCSPPRLLAVAAAGGLVYAGGVVLNDVFDARVDAVKHPQRPLPTGAVARGTAAGFGAGLLLAGLGAAACAGMRVALAYGVVVGFVLLYDMVLKRVGLLGALGMGLCRGGNVIAAGLAAPAFADRWLADPGTAWLAGAPWAALAVAATLASLLEDRPRGHRAAPFAAAGVMLAAALVVPLLRRGGSVVVAGGLVVPAEALAALPLGLLALVLGRALVAVRRREDPAAVGLVVREAVFGFLLLDAAALAAAGRAVPAAVAVGAWFGLRWMLARRRS